MGGRVRPRYDGRVAEKRAARATSVRAQVNRGIIPRALEQILRSMDTGKHKGWAYTLERHSMAPRPIGSRGCTPRRIGSRSLEPHFGRTRASFRPKLTNRCMCGAHRALP
jgi:hypothetical protein